MGKYILRRFLTLIPVVMGVILLIFVIMSFSPSNPAQIILGPGATQEAIAALNTELGYDKPILYRYFKFLGDLVFKGDLGISYAYDTPVAKLVFERLGVTVFLSFSAVFVAAVVGILAGVVSAVKQYSASDRIITFVSLFLAATPSFWLAMMMIYYIALKLQLLPAYGSASLIHFILPSLSLGLPYAAQVLRYTRSSMLECTRQDYMDTARAKGVPERKVIWRHGFRNAVLPVITITGQTFGALIGGAVVNEQIYGISGLGTLLVAAIKSKDIPIVTGTVVVLATIFSVVMLLVDLMHALIDPRVRARYSSQRG